MTRVLCLLISVCWGLAQADLPQDLQQTLHRLGPEVAQRVKARFQSAELDYPPERVQLIALKESRRLELWAYQEGDWRFVHDYAIFAASGVAGPKLREGDRQVPEGFYRIVGLNPNSNFHLSMKLNYPNAYDWVQAGREGRSAPGSNIYIHGSAWSKGCLAIGDHYIEELFYLVADIGMDRAAVLIAPFDFRLKSPHITAQPEWIGDLYTYLSLRLKQFPVSRKVQDCAYGCLDARYSRLRDNRP
ncbi:MAG: L,D-transpeptidase family protein [Candidatus Thiodiazotropha sp.]